MNWLQVRGKKSNEKGDLVLVLTLLISVGSSTQTEIGREVKVGDRNFLKSYIFFIIKSAPPNVQVYQNCNYIFAHRFLQHYLKLAKFLFKIIEK